jgi:HD-GYP domain-containing protein (c-di-GMP phosphodiesterase class II)
VISRDTLVGSAAGTLLTRLYQALSVARIHELTNTALDEPLEILRASLAVVIGAQGSASIKPDAASQLVFLNERVVRTKKQGSAPFEPLVKILAQYGIGELRFDRSIKSEQLRDFLRTCKESASLDPREACRSLRQKMAAAHLPISVFSTDEVQAMAVMRSIKVDDAVAARLAYARCLALLQAFVERLGDPELARYFWRKLVRGMSSLQALASRARNDLLAVTSVRDVAEPFHHHAVNTSILAILLGQHANLPKAQIVPLGVAGLLHALGRPPAPSSAAARDAYRSVATFFGMGQLDDTLLLATLVSFQYAARKGDPETRVPLREVHPIARIVAIVEAYDGLIAGGPGKDAVRPDKAMGLLLQGTPRAFDMALLGTFAGMLGTFPPGTAVEVDTGDMGIVCEPNPEDPNHPVVAVVRDRQGKDVDGAILDLSLLAPSGRHAHNLKRAVDPVKLGLKIPAWQVQTWQVADPGAAPPPPT